MAEYNDDLGGPKYQDMYSVLPLCGPQNEAAGRVLCSFYNNDRILNMDPYHIKVRTPQAPVTQGTASTPRAAAGDPGDEPDVPNQDDDACGNP
ncbi:hypothetical protein HUT06_17755 [Actinomadura sp. NAK00032]|uniref:hypothetical protein n=1 Tax=Actinomadura sp. NAK00032 TaxID=2742128 RepID=UPI001591E8A7|nr:hypothetical protein [Actinomadura sp. NAK00032]QKW35656.1 hypothetical protein HUT06_17755 [Actinomadura sp. NAK00032]